MFSKVSTLSLNGFNRCNIIVSLIHVGVNEILVGDATGCVVVRIPSGQFSFFSDMQKGTVLMIKDVTVINHHSRLNLEIGRCSSVSIERDIAIHANADNNISKIEYTLK